MRKILLLLGVIGLLFLAACGDSDTANESPKNQTQAPQEDEQINEENNDEPVEESTEPENDTNNEEEVTEEEDEKPEETSASSVEEILLKAAEVMESVETFTISGEAYNLTTVMDIETEQHSVLNGSISLNPFVQHLTMEFESIVAGHSESGKMETYFTPEAMYVYDTGLDQWLSLSVEQSFLDLSGIMTDSHYDHYVQYHEQFEMTEDDSHYILTLAGSGDVMKEVLYGAVKELLGEEGYQMIAFMIKDVSGTYEIFIDKETYYLVAVNTDIELTMDMGFGEGKSVDQSRYQYSDYNNTEPVIVPEEVINNAVDVQ